MRSGPAAQAQSPIRTNDEMYHPMIVIGCAIEKRIRRAMFMSRTRLEIRAIANCTALIATSLFLVSKFTTGLEDMFWLTISDHLLESHSAQRYQAV